MENGERLVKIGGKVHEDDVGVLKESTVGGRLNKTKARRELILIVALSRLSILAYGNPLEDFASHIVMVTKQLFLSLSVSG